MKEVADILSEKKVVKSKITSERQEAVQGVLLFMGEVGHHRYGYWNGRLKHLKPSEIYDLIKEAKTGKNPPAFFNWLLKKK